MQEKMDKEGELGSKTGRGLDSEKKLHSWKSSLWSDVIEDAVWGVVDFLSKEGQLTPSYQRLANWALWMMDEGFRFNLGQERERAREVLGMSGEEEREMWKLLTEVGDRKAQEMKKKDKP